jgi:hypothetical protein
MPTTFEELAGSPILRVTERETIARRMFRVPWADWKALASSLIGSYSTAGCSFVFTPPIEFPGMPNLVVAEIEVEPLEIDHVRGDEVTAIDLGTNSYPAGGAKLTATYRTLFDTENLVRAGLPAVPAGTYLTYQADLGGEDHPVPGRVWHYDDPPTNPALPADIIPNLFLPSGRFRLTWHRVPLPPWEVIRDIRGKVNNDVFLGSPAQTVLFMGARISHNFHFSASGGFWTVEYHFAERAMSLASGGKAGWNHEYKETAVGGEHWIEIADASGNPPYHLSDFGSLFTFGAC